MPATLQGPVQCRCRENSRTASAVKMQCSQHILSSADDFSPFHIKHAIFHIKRAATDVEQIYPRAHFTPCLIHRSKTHQNRRAQLKSRHAFPLNVKESVDGRSAKLRKPAAPRTPLAFWTLLLLCPVSCLCNATAAQLSKRLSPRIPPLVTFSRRRRGHGGGAFKPFLGARVCIAARLGRRCLPCAHGDNGAR